MKEYNKAQTEFVVDFQRVLKENGFNLMWDEKTKYNNNNFEYMLSQYKRYIEI